MSQRAGSVARFWSRSGILSVMFLLAYGSWHTPVGFADAVKVYRCSGKGGVVEFRQQYCDQRHQEAVQVDTTPSGWIPPRRKSESNRAKRVGKQRSKAVFQSASRTAELKQKQEKDCWHTQKRLDKLQSRMRRGYKAGKGPGLRRQRRDYEDYLRKFC